MKTSTTSLYINQNGMICCVLHGGSYLRSEYAHRSEQCFYSTPLDSWQRIDDEYVVEWTSFVGTAPACEICS
jgi:hypothetical protein